MGDGKCGDGVELSDDTFSFARKGAAKVATATHHSYDKMADRTWNLITLAVFQIAGRIIRVGSLRSALRAIDASITVQTEASTTTSSKRSYELSKRRIRGPGGDPNARALATRPSPQW